MSETRGRRQATMEVRAEVQRQHVYERFRDYLRQEVNESEALLRCISGQGDGQELIIDFPGGLEQIAGDIKEVLERQERHARPWWGMVAWWWTRRLQRAPEDWPGFGLWLEWED